MECDYVLSGKGLLFGKTSDKNVAIFTDADWARSITDIKLTSGYCTYIWETW